MTNEKVRRSVVNGTTHTDASLAAMKTGDIARLVAEVRGGKIPKPATKSKAIELFWKATEGLHKEPEVPGAGAEAPGAKKSPKKAKKVASKTVSRFKRYGIELKGSDKLAKVRAMTPLAQRFVEKMKAAGRPLSMEECGAIIGKISRSNRPEKFAAWHFCKLFRPAGILVESRADRGA